MFNHLGLHVQRSSRGPLASLAFTFFTYACSGPPRAEVVESGLCELRGKGIRYAHPQSLTGYGLLGDAAITRQTDVVPLRKGIGFGFTWRGEGFPENLNVVYRVEHPEITKADGSKSTSFDEPMVHSAAKGRIETTDSYLLNDERELVEGDWTLSIVHSDVVLVKRTFHVVRQPQA